MSKFVDFINRNKVKVFTGIGTASALAMSTVSAFASGTDAGTYTPRAVPTAQPLTFESLGSGWNYAQSMLQDSIAIASQYPLVIFAMITMPMISIGIGLFKKLIY